MRASELLQAAAELAAEARSDATPWDARVLLAHVLGRKNPLAVDPLEEVGADAESNFWDHWRARLAGQPVQHLIGRWDFYGRAFRVDERALIPRPETETLVTAALREAPDALRILDAGTGSGVLAITLLLEKPAARGVALDASVEALALARENAANHGVLSRLRLLASDWTSAVGRTRFDLAVSNPPYLALNEAESLPATVREHDPANALFAGADALCAIRRLLDELPRLLEPRAPFLFEIGFGQAGVVERMVRAHESWQFGRIDPDLARIPRVAIARLSPTRG